MTEQPFWKFLLVAFAGGLLSPFTQRRDTLRDVMAQRCADGGTIGHCWCRSAATCRFDRCTNCDMPVDKSGRALLDDISDVDHHAGPCPYCDGPMPRL